jgi:hypothetical protein
MTQHRCTDGTWREGKTIHCTQCQSAGLKRPVKVKRRLET